MTTIMPTLKKSKHGFTLIEIVVVMTIISILSAIAIPSLLGFGKNLHKKVLIDEAKTIYVAATNVLAKQIAKENTTFLELSRAMSFNDDGFDSELEKMLSPAILSENMDSFSQYGIATKMNILVFVEKTFSVTPSGFIRDFTGNITQIVYPQDGYLIIIKKNSPPQIISGYDEYGRYYINYIVFWLIS